MLALAADKAAPPSFTLIPDHQYAEYLRLQNEGACADVLDIEGASLSFAKKNLKRRFYLSCEALDP